MSSAQGQQSAIVRYRVLRELGRRSQPSYAAARADGSTSVVVIHRFTRESLRGDGERKVGVVSPEVMGLLLRDARCLAKHWHPNVALVRHVDLVGDTLFIATDLVDGVTLEELLALASSRRTQTGEPLLSHAVIARIFLDVLSGLQALHGLRDDMNVPLSIFHGELCPANVVVGKDGVARIIAPFRPRPVRITGASEALGYASPETLAGEVEQDARVDIYAVGVMLWEALMERHLYPDPNPARIAQRQREEDVPPPDGPLSDIVLKALAFDPLLRFRTASDMAASLRGSAEAIAAGSAVAQIIVEHVGERIRTRRVELQPSASGQRRAVQLPPNATRSGAHARAALVPKPVVESPTPLAPPVRDGAPRRPSTPRQMPVREIRLRKTSTPDVETEYVPRPPPARRSSGSIVAVRPPPPPQAPKRPSTLPPVTTPPRRAPQASSSDDELLGPRSRAADSEYLATLAIATPGAIAALRPRPSERASAIGAPKASDDEDELIESADIIDTGPRRLARRPRRRRRRAR
jgi:serine/threonine-protein kinase